MVSVWTENLDPQDLLDIGEDLVEDLAEDGRLSKEESVHAVARFLDALVPASILIPGPLGVLAEEADGPAFQLLVDRLSTVFKVDPEKRAARKAARRERISARRAKIAERRSDRMDRHSRR